MNILITICGRAGSKGVKDKNIRKFLNIPLVEYTICAAELFKEKNKQYNIDICVNSDSIKLLELASSYNEVININRPKEFSEDNSPKIPVIRYSLNYMESKLNKIYEYIIDLDITSPLRKIKDIENALNKCIGKPDLDVVFSVVNSRRNPYFNMVENKNGKIKKVLSSDFVARQQAPEVYDMNASIYCYKRDSLINIIKNTVFEGKCGIILMQDTGIIDIDSEEDFILMEVIAKYLFNKEFSDIYKYTMDNSALRKV